MVFVLFSCGGPFYRQVLGGKDPRRIIRTWRMFRVYGQNICEVAYALPNADGTLEPIDRRAALNYQGWQTAENGQQRVTSERHARAIGRRLCTRLDVKTLHGLVRFGAHTASGWPEKIAWAAYLCADAG